jgi:hypothetical protein
MKSYLDADKIEKMARTFFEETGKMPKKVTMNKAMFRKFKLVGVITTFGLIETVVISRGKLEVL